MSALEQLLEHPAIRRGRPRDGSGHGPGWPSGQPGLDALLGGSGWPLGQLIELLGEPFGSGETRLLVPMLTACGQSGGWLALVAPPATPWLPGWRQLGIPTERILLLDTQHDTDTLWSSEQCLRDPQFGALLAWARGPLPTPGLRRLRLAAAESRACAILYRPSSAAAQPSPAHQRLRWRAGAEGLELEALKGNGAWTHSGQALHIPHSEPCSGSRPGSP